MPLSPGDRLGPYEIVAVIGKGGMGEVWKARDPRLNRDVAIKVAAQQFSDRFEREARAIAALNRPNVCTLYHIGPNYLVMEYIDGPTLGERIHEGPIPLEEALTIAKQIAEALEAAHEKNIVHRDLKPANVKIRPDGSVKVLDFGLAKAGDTQAVTPDSPTMIPATQIGMILGTAGYMSPEQARGKTVDKRADIWAFGVVLYELMTGKQLFAGETVTDLLADVVTKEPDLNAVPLKVRRLIGSCLEKDPKKRLRDIGDVWRLLDEPHATTTRPRRLMLLPWAAVAVFAVAAVLGWTRASRPPVTAPVSVALSMIPPRGTELIAPGGLGVEKISPDGAAVLFRTIGIGLNVRRLDSMKTEPMPPFDWAGAAFWAPDSKSIAFPAANGLFKMHLPGGAPQLVSQDLVIGERGGTWAADGTILFATIDSSPGGIGLHRVSADGGKAQPVEVQGLKEGRYLQSRISAGPAGFPVCFLSARVHQHTNLSGHSAGREGRRREALVRE
jgi:predicted Ser/Thr protein kinase